MNRQLQVNGARRSRILTTLLAALSLLLFSSDSAGEAMSHARGGPSLGSSDLSLLYDAVIPSDQFFISSASDPTRGDFYFGTHDYWIANIAVGLDGSPRLVGSFVAEKGSGGGLATDPANGLLYVGVGDKIVKMAVGSDDELPYKISEWESVDGDLSFTRPQFLKVSPDGDFLYFMDVSGDTRRIHKFQCGGIDQTPTPLHVVTLTGHTEGLGGVVYDFSSNHALVALGGSTGPNKIVKINLGEGAQSPEVIGSLTLSDDQNFPQAGIVDEVRHVAWFGTYNSPSEIIQVSMGAVGQPPVYDGALLLDETENAIKASAKNGDIAIFCTSNKLLKVDISGKLPVRIGSETYSYLQPGPIEIDVKGENGVVAFGFGNTNNHLEQFRVGSDDSPTSATGGTDLPAAMQYMNDAVVDESSGYMFSGASEALGKFHIPEEDGPVRFLGSARLNVNSGNIYQPAYDPVSNTVIGILSSSTAKLIRFDAGIGESLPVFLQTVGLPVEDGRPTNMELDPNRRAMFVQTNSTPRKVIRFDLANDGTFVRAGAVALPPECESVLDFILDSSTGELLVYDGFPNSTVARVSPGVPGGAPSLNGSLVSSTSGSGHAVYDETRRMLFVVDGSNIRRYHIPIESGPPELISTLPHDSSLAGSVPLLMDKHRNRAFFADSGYVGTVDLEPTSPGIHRSGLLALDPFSHSSMIAVHHDSDDARLIALVNNGQGRVLTIGTEAKDVVFCQQVEVEESDTPNTIQFKTVNPGGNLRLAVYTSGESPELLWKSPTTPNQLSGEWLSVPFELGTPSNFTTPPGRYLIAWVTDQSGLVAEPLGETLTPDPYFYLGDADFPATIVTDPSRYGNSDWHFRLATVPRDELNAGWLAR